MTVYLVFYAEATRSFLVEVFATEELAVRYVSESNSKRMTASKYIITPWEVVS
jgi:hypothetical protein